LKRKIPKIVKEIKKTVFPPIEYATQKSISYSQISMFHTCPHRWKLTYKDGHKLRDINIHLVFGTALHETLQLYLTTIYEENIVKADKLDLEEHFKKTLREEYQKSFIKNKKQHFSSSIELREFYEDGIEIIKFVKKKRGEYFSKRGWWIAGCEIPLQLPVNNAYNNVIFTGYLDVVLYHEPTNTIKIIDIKTSTRGWDKKTKADDLKNTQLITYKRYFSEQYNFPIDNIEIEFFIVKRKIYDSEWGDRRIQIHVPASGKVKINKSKNLIEEFVTNSFDKKGKYKDGDYPKRPSQYNCSFCPFNDRSDLCDKK